MRRISLVGVPGSGKTTVGRMLAGTLDAPFVELDAIFHQPGWAELAKDDFRDRVRRVVAEDAWIVDGNYSAVRDLVLQRADAVLWLDLPRPLVMRRLIRRTLGRAVTREQLWNGNREPLTNLFRLDPEKNLLRWAWIKHALYVEQYEQEMSDPHHHHVQFVRLHSAQEVSDFVARSGSTGPFDRTSLDTRRVAVHVRKWTVPSLHGTTLRVQGRRAARGDGGREDLG